MNKGDGNNNESNKTKAVLNFMIIDVSIKALTQKF